MLALSLDAGALAYYFRGCGGDIGSLALGPTDLDLIVGCSMTAGLLAGLRVFLSGEAG